MFTASRRESHVHLKGDGTTLRVVEPESRLRDFSIGCVHLKTVPFLLLQHDSRENGGAIDLAIPWRVEMKIQDVMTPNPMCCLPEDTSIQAARIMGELNVGIVPVVKSSIDHSLVGV
jgi:CBS domain-containing protein